MSKSIFSLLSLATALVLAGAPALAQTGDTLGKIRQSGVLSVGAREASGALSYSLGSAGYAGFHIDICQHIAADIQKQLQLPKLDLRYISVTNANRVVLTQNGTVDIECGSTTNTTARQRDVAFAPTLFMESVKLLVKKGSGITSMAQLRGKTVVSATGGTAAQHLRRLKASGKLDFNGLHAKDNAEAFLMLEGDRADAFANDSQILATLASTARDKGAYQILPEALSVEPISIMFRKDDPAFKKLVDDSVARLVSSGEIKTIYDKWFVQPIAPRDVAVGLPVSSETRAAWADLNDRPMEAYATSE